MAEQSGVAERSDADDRLRSIRQRSTRTQSSRDQDQLMRRSTPTPQQLSFLPHVQESSLRVECCKVGSSKKTTIELNVSELRSREEDSAQWGVIVAWLEKTETCSTGTTFL